MIVGPNNSGKSLMLREIEYIFKIPAEHRRNKLIADFSLKWPENASEELNRLVTRQRVFRHEASGQRYIRVPYHPGDENLADIQEDYANKIIIGQRKDQAHLIYKSSVMRLGGVERAQVLLNGEIYDPRKPPKSAIGFLHRQKAAKSLMRESVYKAFGKYPVIDPTRGSSGLQMRS